MKARVKVMRWTPDDYVVVYQFDCAFMWVAKFVKFCFRVAGWHHVFISKKVN